MNFEEMITLRDAASAAIGDWSNAVLAALREVCPGLEAVAIENDFDQDEHDLHPRAVLVRIGNNVIRTERIDADTQFGLPETDGPFSDAREKAALRGAVKDWESFCRILSSWVYGPRTEQELY